MRNTAKALALILVIGMIFTLVLTGCSKSETSTIINLDDIKELRAAYFCGEWDGTLIKSNNEIVSVREGKIWRNNKAVGYLCSDVDSDELIKVEEDGTWFLSQENVLKKMHDPNQAIKSLQLDDGDEVIGITETLIVIRNQNKLKTINKISCHSETYEDIIDVMIYGENIHFTTVKNDTYVNMQIINEEAVENKEITPCLRYEKEQATIKSYDDAYWANYDSIFASINNHEYEVNKDYITDGGDHWLVNYDGQILINNEIMGDVQTSRAIKLNREAANVYFFDDEAIVVMKSGVWRHNDLGARILCSYNNDGAEIVDAKKDKYVIFKTYNNDNVGNLVYVNLETKTYRTISEKVVDFYSAYNGIYFMTKDGTVKIFNVEQFQSELFVEDAIAIECFCDEITGAIMPKGKGNSTYYGWSDLWTDCPNKQ